MRIDPAIQAEFREKRARALKEHEARMAAVYERAPMLRTLDQKRSSIIYERGLALLRADGDAGRAAARTAADEAIAALDEKRLELLSNMGLSEKDLRPRFECERCSDTGYTDEARAIRCACFENRLLAGAFAYSNLNDTERFEAFRTDIYGDAKIANAMLKIRRMCEEYADSFPHAAVPGILLIGEAGLSKSFLLNCIGLRVMERGHSVLKVTASGLMNDYLTSIRERSARPDHMAPELFIIDDLGTEPLIENITREYLFAIISEREAASRPVLIATNLDSAKLLRRYYERLFSRLTAPRAFSVIELEGADVRKRL